MQNDLLDRFGNIDIYLFDQLLKGRFDGCRKVIDIGCGSGRNLPYFLQNGFEVYGVDADPYAVETVKELSLKLAPANPLNNFVVVQAESLPFADETFDLAICSAVLHFAQNRQHFEAMLKSIWRIIRPGAYFFARLASDIGIEALVKPLGDGLYDLPDGSVRYLVNLEQLLDYTQQLGGVLFEPVKTTNVHNLRCMTTWCLQKSL
jgi:SAM-dependent methyltransferase